MSAAHLVWDVGAFLGEGPVWLTDEQALRFVDIKAGRLHRFVPAKGVKETETVGGKPSFILPTHDRGFLVGSELSIHRIDAAGRTRTIAEIDMPAHNRTNDATIDCFGRLWFGTMDDEEARETGKLYCLENGALHCHGCDAVVTNGPAISSDGRTLYHVNSGARTIWRYTIEAGPSLIAGEPFLQLQEADGYPDGIVLDADDCLWVSLWDGWSVRRYDPDGAFMMHVELPCARVTKLAFGGEDLRTAFVTTARVGLSESQLAAQPLAGGLFAFEAPAAGRVTPLARS